MPDQLEFPAIVARTALALAGGSELPYIKSTRKEQTSLPARVLTGKSRNSKELLRLLRIAMNY